MRSRRPTVGAVAFVLGVATVGLVLLPATPAAAATECTQQDVTVTCSFPGGVSTWTVPYNIVPNSVTTIIAQGQAGDVGTSKYPNGLVSSGGNGAKVSAGFVLNVGAQYTVTVPVAQGIVSSAPGGGGNGQQHTNSNGRFQAGNGGGFAGVTFPDAPGGLVVAGGGGGGGSGGALDPSGPVPTALRGGYGGDAGLPNMTAGTGATGDSRDPLTGGHGGYGGTADHVGGAGGPGGSGTIVGGGGGTGFCSDFLPGVDGASGAPGLGANTVYASGPEGGAGGGGYGGGGSGGSGAYIYCLFPFISAGGGGGGGSSYVDPSAVAPATSSIADTTYAQGGAVTISYTITPPDFTAPVAAIDPVASPRLDAVDSLHFEYSEAVNTTPHYTLTRNGVDIPDLPPTEFQFDQHGNFIGVTLDVAALTSASGVYVFTVPAAGITDLSGNPVANDASTTWTNTSVTGTFGAVDSPRATGVDSIPLTFDTDVTGVDIGDFRIFRDGSPTPLTGVTLSGSGPDYSLDGLGDLTAPEEFPVNWELDLRGPDETGIVNQYGTVAPETSVAFTVDAAAAPTASFTAVDTPRSTALDQAQLTFDEPVYAVDITDFSLTRNGDPVDLSAASVTGHGADYTISGLSTLTAPGHAPADYVLSLNDSGTNITNDEGVDLASGASLDFTVEALPVPVVTSVAPTSGPAAGGQQMTITGTGFTGATAVYVAGRVSFTVDSDTQITATVPAHAPGLVPVYVHTPNGTSRPTPADRYRFLPAPVVGAVSPARGPLGGGATVRISGTAFSGATAVLFGGTDAVSYTIVSPDRIIAIAPPGSAGPVDVTVRTPNGEDTSPQAYTYQAAPVVTNVVANSGVSTGGDSVTITGTDFTAASAVYFSKSSPVATFHVDSDIRITVTSPAHALGAVNVRVHGPGGTSPITKSDHYTYQDPNRADRWRLISVLSSPSAFVENWSHT